MIKFDAGQPVAVNLATINEALAQIRSDALGGWFTLPIETNASELADIKSAATKIQSDSKYLVCIGIGGSYLGHRALIEAIAPESPTKVLYAGNSLSARELEKVISEIGEADFSVNVISKSGTTTEPAIGFRFFRDILRKKYSEAANERIYVTTDARAGALYSEANQENYHRFVVPDNLGGRYSVLSSVGLLPLAAAGVDIDELLAGAAAEYHDTFARNIADAPVVKYATSRANLLKENFDVEVLASFEPSLQYFAEWWKQLFGESEGKNGQGIFPASTIYTTDLHSLGQYLQDGRRNIFETMLCFDEYPNAELAIPDFPQNLDQLNYLSGKTLGYVTSEACAATILAHRAGNIPVFEIAAPNFSAKTFGALVYFFELACALSAKLSGVNPFDQPAVDVYKTAMFHRLGKPGF